ncbi:MAG: MarR family transcriptional regulator [Alphaproteobacteria bacterium]|nr:MarR family transcriptional regulator [Alphaproteobacteria bacterium]
MSRKELVQLMESNIMILERLACRLQRSPRRNTGMPRQQMSVLMRLHINGRAKLKDIALREGVPTPNLCATFRKLEHGGLILRAVDETDRRNTWYQVTERGAELARQAMEYFMDEIGNMFKDLSADDECKMVESLKTINQILTKME